MGRLWVTTAVLILGGALASSSFILAKKPNAKDLFAKVAPYQGTIGVIMFLWGIWDVIQIVIHLSELTSMLAVPLITWKIAAIMLPVTAIVELVLGFLLGFGMIQSFAAKKNPAAAQKSEAVMKKLAPHQTWLGFVGIASAIWWLLFNLVFFKAAFS